MRVGPAPPGPVTAGGTGVTGRQWQPRPRAARPRRVAAARPARARRRDSPGQWQWPRHWQETCQAPDSDRRPLTAAGIARHGGSARGPRQHAGGAAATGSLEQRLVSASGPLRALWCASVTSDRHALVICALMRHVDQGVHARHVVGMMMRRGALTGTGSSAGTSVFNNSGLASIGGG